MLELERVADVDFLSDLVVHGVDVGLVHGHAAFGQRGRVVNGNIVQLGVMRPVLVYRKEGDEYDCYKINRISFQQQQPIVKKNIDFNKCLSKHKLLSIDACNQRSPKLLPSNIAKLETYHTFIQISVIIIFQMHLRNYQTAGIFPPTNAIWFSIYEPKISSNSWARPNANTGIRQRPPLLTMSCTRRVKRDSRSSRGSWMCVPYVDSCVKEGHK